MALRKVARRSADEPPVRSAEPLYREIRAILESARAGAYHAVNAAMVQAYWNVGRLIVEHEQGGAKRAAYGEAVLEELSRRLMAEFGRGFDVTNLRKMRQFHRMFQIRDAVRLGSGANPIRHAVRAELSWSHYRLLMQVENPTAREWYMHEAADQHWSTRQLERQISVLYYDRLLASRKTAPVRNEAATKLVTIGPEQFIRDPYVLEFLDLKDDPALRESAVEQAIVNNLQAFLLELGKGFSFVARQKRMRFEDEDFYVDLVFYNYLLKCFVLVDLKVGKKNEAIARYSVLSEGRQLFAAKYLKVLPTERELTHQIERERRLIDARQAEEEKR